MNEEFNVVIAEDEKRICSLIKALIDWDGLHLRLVGEAHDGVQALTLLQQEKVDILITDIRMPGVNGLDLTKWVNDHCNQCSVIIISGYKQFDYAYDALRMDVVDFLLKPIKKTEINNAISKIVQKRSVSSPNTSTIQLEVQQFRTSLRRQCIFQTLIDDLANRGTSVLVVVAASSEILTGADNLFEFDQEGNCYQKLDHQNHRLQK